jgi:serine/threonine protein kinase
VALALDDLHRQDAVHLDLKPTNVMFRATGEAVLIDFGLARHGHLPDLLAEELRIPIGNWVYMAPEQMLGVRCDPRSDVYALGGILYELATGHLPFGHPHSVAELRRRLYRDPVPPKSLAPGIPEWLQEIILRCLEVDASERFSSARELAVALATPAEVALTERSTRQRRAGLWTLARRRLAAMRFEPAPCPPPSTQSTVPRVVAVAIAPQESNERLRGALRGAVKGSPPPGPARALPASPSSLPLRRCPASATRIRPPAATSGAWWNCALGRSRWSCPKSA